MGLISSSFSSKPKKEKKEDNKAKYKRLQDERIVKLLLYGPGEVGKTTILRKMMLIHGNDLTAQRKQYRPYLCYNVIEGAYLIIRHAKMLLKFDFTTPGVVKRKDVEYTVTEEDVMHAKRIMQAMIYHQNMGANKTTLNPSPAGNALPKPDEMPNGPAVVESIKHLYKTNKFFQKMITLKHNFSLYENWTYFADKLDEYPAWGGDDWNPSDEDLLMSRLRTTGLNKFIFQYENTKFQLIDVGGQRQERRLFFSLFSQVDAVLFVTSLSDYDEKCYEDINQNRLTEAMQAWGKAVRSDAFKDVWVILMFNKLDLFKKKYYDEKKRIKLRFKTKEKPPKWEDEENRDCAKALKWFENLYLDQVGAEKKHQVRTYFTSALGESEGESNIATVMQYCVDFLINKLIETGAGFA